MAVITWSHQKRLLKELDNRYGNLRNILIGRKLQCNTEGAKKGYWRIPENMRYISKTDLNLAVEDFSTILKEIKKIKC